MTDEDIFESWAPRGALWSPWVKPVLFASLASLDRMAGLEPLARDTSWAPAPAEHAIVVDLAGAVGVWTGIALAAVGYRPVPLYNAVSSPSGRPVPSAISLVDVSEIAAALLHCTPRLQQLRLASDAPPAFLLDANRRGGGSEYAPNRFDNRSISFTTDFPSAAFLGAQGIRRCLLVQLDGGQPQPDLAHTLRRWQEGGIAIELERLASGAPIAPLVVEKPSGFRSLFHRALAIAGLRRFPLGGFGGIIPDPSEGGGFAG